MITQPSSLSFNPAMEILAVLCLLAAIVLLVALSIIDLKYLILPDELNATLAACGVAFHVLMAYWYLDLAAMAFGALVGAGFLYIIRYGSNKHYGRDTLGLGDVKLMGAAGVWLGGEGVVQAITVGALAGLVHGLVYAWMLSRKNKTKFTISHLSIPAGPGFAFGILLVGGWMYHSLITEVLHDIFS